VVPGLLSGDIKINNFIYHVYISMQWKALYKLLNRISRIQSWLVKDFFHCQNQELGKVFCHQVCQRENVRRLTSTSLLSSAVRLWVKPLDIALYKTISMRWHHLWPIKRIECGAMRLLQPSVLQKAKPHNLQPQMPLRVLQRAFVSPLNRNYAWIECAEVCSTGL
jgi:hypothetical protein